MEKRNSFAIKRRMTERMIWHAEQPLLKEPNYPGALLDLAARIAPHGYQVQALHLCRKAANLGDALTQCRARQVVASFVPGYHIPMMNDLKRNAAWEEALQRAIRPGMRVLEIGTGAGMLAMMAARAGAQVVTCEFYEVVAAVAEETVKLNGFQDRIQIHAKSSRDLELGSDLETRAELLFCDNFSDNMFSFQPLASIADARRRLLKPGAPCIPAAASVRLALGQWSGYARFFQAVRNLDFDLSPVASFIPDSIDLELGDPGTSLHSSVAEAFRFDFSQSRFPEHDSAQAKVEVLHDCEVNGIVQWIRLDLDSQTFLEARPEPGQVSFSNPRFHPLPSPLQLKAGDKVTIQAQHNGKDMLLYLEEGPAAASTPS